MIKLNNLKLKPGFDEGELKQLAAKKLGVLADDIASIKRLKQAVDARSRQNIHFSLSIGVTLNQGIAPSADANFEIFEQESYTFPFAGLKYNSRPIIAGSGPAGQFCALMLARAGLRPILLERGQDVCTRTADVEQFFSTGILNSSSNIQFGEGGAGTFSDGKLSTGTKDMRHRFILEQYFKAGATEDITYLAKPHIGTDILRSVVQNFREEILSLGGEVRFGCTVSNIAVKNNALKGINISCNGAEEYIETPLLILATGHSARDTFYMLHDAGVHIEPKNFAVGVRIEHLQHSIDMAQYGNIADFKALPASEYKLAAHSKTERSVFSFCVCPGGSVVGAASEQDMLATNGMSEYLRNGKNINGALLVGIAPEDFGGALNGIEFQRKLEADAFKLGGGGFVAPAQLVGDFLAGKASSKFGKVLPTYRPAVRPTDIRLCLPEYITEAIKQALPILGKKIRGFDAEDAVLTAVESRSSSPVRIVRNDGFESNIRGLFPCGEGAGYAGGIMSAAADGIRCAEAVCQWL